MKIKFLLPNLILLAAAFWVIPLHAQLGLALIPMRTEIRIAPGMQNTQSLRLSNDSPEPVRVRADALDFYIDKKLTPQFGLNYQRERKFSCRTWLQINPREFDLPAKGTARVRYTLQVPAGIPQGEYHCGAGFLTLPRISRNDTPMGVHMAVRAVTSVYVIIGNPVSKPILKDVFLRKLPGGTWQAVTLFENKGDRLFRIKGYIELQDAKGRLIEKLSYPPFPVLPEREQLFPLPLKTAPAPGTYILHVRADVGLPTILDASTRVAIDGSLRARK